jgi:hypothetical protein
MTPPASGPNGIWRTFIKKVKGAIEIIGNASNSVGIFALSLIAMLVLPCLPLAIEWLHSSHIANGTKTVTAAVLSSGFLFSAEHYVYRSVYAVLFLGSLLLTFAVGPESPAGIERWDGTFLLVVALFHCSERLYWHVFLDRPFPDWVRPGG